MITSVSLRGKNNRIVNSSPLPSLVDNRTGKVEVRAQDFADVCINQARLP